MPSLNRPLSSTHSWQCILIACGWLMVCATGCVGTLANIMHVAHGNLVPASYTGLRSKRVAVVCVSNSEAFGPTTASVTLARNVGKMIQTNVPEVELVDQQEIENWIDRSNWDYLDYQAVGQGVEADMIVAIDLDSFSLHEGKTLFKGRADVRVVVYDIVNNQEVFTYTPNQIQFPENMGHHTTDTSEAAFRRKFLNLVARRISRQFYPYDVKEDFAADATLIR